MESKASIVESLLEKIEDYTNTSLKIYKLKAIDRSSEITSSIISYAIIGLCVLIVLVILNIALALWLGKIIGESYLGFLAVAALNMVIGFILYLLRHKFLKRPIVNSLIKKMYN
jgi:hypothetical protein